MNISQLEVEGTLKDFFLAGDAHRLPFRRESFDTTIAFSVLEYVSDPVKVMKEAF
jgi:ubiquinone/menaquinone biosynthesis C-methylase UbiE